MPNPYKSFIGPPKVAFEGDKYPIIEEADRKAAWAHGPVDSFVLAAGEIGSYGSDEFLFNGQQVMERTTWSGMRRRFTRWHKWRLLLDVAKAQQQELH